MQSGKIKVQARARAGVNFGSASRPICQEKIRFTICTIAMRAAKEPLRATCHKEVTEPDVEQNSPCEV